MARIIPRGRRFLAHCWTYIANATTRYAWGVLFLSIAGIAVAFLGSKYLEPGTIPADMVRSLSDAILVSAILAVLVDPYLKRRMQDESGWAALFGYLNPKAPKGLREALRDLATCRRYFEEASWEINFDWHDQEHTVLEVTLEVSNTGVNLDVNPYRPNGRPWVLASIHGHDTKYLRYSLYCPGHIRIDLHDDELDPYVVAKDDRSIFVDESRLQINGGVPPDASFDSVHVARMYRHATGYIPLHHNKYVERLPFTLTGTALHDIDIRVSHPANEGQAKPSEWLRHASEAPNPDKRQFGRATPGQVTLVSWGPGINKGVAEG